MQVITFDALADLLKHGREIEFFYNGKQYSITNHSGFWYFCDDTEHVLLDTLCPFREKELLVSKVSDTAIDGISIRQIFDDLLYDSNQLHII